MPQYCTFRLAEHDFGIPVATVQEVLREQDLTPVPLSAPELSGLMNLRGQIVATINLRRRLRLPPRDDGAASVHVVVQTADATAVSLVVDRIGEVLEPAETSIEGVPDTVDPELRDLVTGVCRLEHGLVLLLDTELAATVGRIS